MSTVQLFWLKQLHHEQDIPILVKECPFQAVAWQKLKIHL
jgi:hypothetical protein